MSKRADNNQKLIIFDVDGTLVNSRAHILRGFEEACVELGLSGIDEDKVLSVVGLSLEKACSVLISEPLKAQALYNYFQRNYQRILNETRKNGMRLYSGIEQLIIKLHSLPNMALGIATGAGRRNVSLLLSQYGWEDVFITIQTADTSPSKPDPHMIIQAMSECGVSEHNTLMVGDTSFDVDMAHSAKVHSVGVLWGNHTRERLEYSGAHHIVSSREELWLVCKEFSNS